VRVEALRHAPVIYPTSDGQRMSEHTAQYHWIVLLKENLEVGLADFVAADLLWYPVEGDAKTRVAPDVMVALGRPKGERGSYRQWEEGAVAPQVVFEVLSPGNSAREMNEKRRFYEKHGVCEYYVVDPDLEAPEQAILEVWVRQEGRLRLADFEGSWTSPLLGVRFARSEGRLTVSHADGQPFLTTAQRKAQADAEIARLRDKLQAMGIDPDAA
jgi:Uma2 family endonuclease